MQNLNNEELLKIENNGQKEKQISSKPQNIGQTKINNKDEAGKN